MGFPNRSNTDLSVQPQKMVRGLKFRIKEVEGLYYLCSENKGAGQLCCYRAADLRLCSTICKQQVSHDDNDDNLLDGWMNENGINV